MVLSMSLWGNLNDDGQMAWLDNELNGPCPPSGCGDSHNCFIVKYTFFFLFLAFQEWYDGDGGKDKWQYFCDFPGNA